MLIYYFVTVTDAVKKVKVADGNWKFQISSKIMVKEIKGYGNLKAYFY